MTKGDKYTVVELAGYIGEADRKSFDDPYAAWDWLEARYGKPDDAKREELKPDVRLDRADGSRTYEI